MTWRSPSSPPPPAAASPRFGLDEDAVESVLSEVEARYLAPKAGARARAQFRHKLHLEDLLLARACARGLEPAWEEFWRRYQARLRGAARALTHETSLANELADSLLGDLFGLRTRDGARVSKLDAYMGLGSLEGWLRALLAQAHVNHWRRERRLVGLDESDRLRTLLVPPPQGESEGASARLRPQLEAALEATLEAVDAPARLLLSLYFLDGQTLAQIGSLLQVHESTISRRLDRVLGQLRRQTRRELARRGMRTGAADAAMHLNPRWLQVDVRKSLQSVAITPTPGNPRGF